MRVGCHADAGADYEGAEGGVQAGERVCVFREGGGGDDVDAGAGEGGADVVGKELVEGEAVCYEGDGAGGGREGGFEVGRAGGEGHGGREGRLNSGLVSN